jgi:hypothetical protein
MKFFNRHGVHLATPSGRPTTQVGSCLPKTQVDAAAGSAPGTEHIRIGHAGDQRRADRRRPPHVMTGSNRVPALDHVHSLVAGGTVDRDLADADNKIEMRVRAPMRERSANDRSQGRALDEADSVQGRTQTAGWSGASTGLESTNFVGRSSWSNDA